MQIRALCFPNSNQPTGGAPAAPPRGTPALSVADLDYYAAGWYLDSEVARHSEATLANRRLVLGKLQWFLTARGHACCGPREVLLFLAHVTNGHREPGGRWGDPRNVRPVSARTVDSYRSLVATFFNWVVGQGGVPESPTARLKHTTVRQDQPLPFTDDQLRALLAAARLSECPARDTAICWVLLDTGVRAAELCGLRFCDLDLTEKRLRVLGKGNKERSVYFGKQCTKALWDYLRGAETDDEGFVFTSERGARKGEPLNRHSLGDMLERLEKRAGIRGVRCSPHTFRHSYAVRFLRAGGQPFTLMENLGHTDLKMTQRYVRLSQADIAGSWRFSPGDALAKSRQGRGVPEQVRRTTERVAEEAREARETRKAPATGAAKVTRAKLTEDQVREIKRRLAERGAGGSAVTSLAQIAAEFGVARSTIKDIAMGHTWGHLT